ncbi:MFS transporter [Hymenobacter chitinivorans]|uniref:Fucose permease n=1 Tax=Hymenobacter chitinivorans DSM 11115 TaxID=1121954 RepID=A0A2M9BRB4_9BACT|nr:MFS transporter [Hymenobacter chitinivorans]PJJ60494.1 fucose permease [Hymenobacter chitinivorans DSM 11115]
MLSLLSKNTVSATAHRVAVSTLFFLQGLCFASWASRIPSIQQKMSLSEAELGLVLITLPVGLMLSLPLSGWLVATQGSRRMALVGAVLYSSTLVSIGWAQNLYQLVGCLFLYGVTSNLMNISVNTQAVGVEALYQRPIMAAFHGLWSLAGFTGAAIGNFMNARGIEPLGHFALIWGGILVGLLACWPYTLRHDRAAAANQPIFARPDQALLGLGLIAFCSMICEGAMFDWSGIYFRKVVLAEKAWVGVGYTAFMSTMAGGRFVADWFAHRYGVRAVLQASGLLTAAGLLLAVLLPALPTAIAGFLLVGFGVSSVVPLVYSAAGKASTMSPGVALAAVSTVGFLGFLIGPPLIGLVAGAANLQISFSIIAVMGLCITLVASRAKV